jgi:transcriptional regulator with XRE-family HTH domain
MGRMIDPADVIARRLEELRLALGYEQQNKFAAELNVEKNTYSPWEKGHAERPLPFEHAVTIRQKWSVPLDWLYFGAFPERLPGDIKDKIEALRREKAKRRPKAG